MSHLNENEKRELLGDADSAERREDFARVKAMVRQLSPTDYLTFLTSASEVSTERKEDRPLMTGSKFLL